MMVDEIDLLISNTYIHNEGFIELLIGFCFPFRIEMNTGQLTNCASNINNLYEL